MFIVVFGFSFVIFLFLLLFVFSVSVFFFMNVVKVLGFGLVDEDNVLDIDVLKYMFVMEMVEVDFLVFILSVDNEKIEVVDKVGMFFFVCKVSLSFDVVFLLLLFVSFVGL